MASNKRKKEVRLTDDKGDEAGHVVADDREWMRLGVEHMRVK